MMLYTIVVLLLGCYSELTKASALNCETQNVQGSLGRITSSNYPQHTNEPECQTWIIYAFAGHVITISFEDYDLSRGRCYDNYVSITSGYDTGTFKICNTMHNIPAVFSSTTNTVNITYVYSSLLPGRGFSLKYISGATDDVCYSGKFKCDNGKCILSKWLCNGASECGDGSDEKNCYSGITPVTPPTGYKCEDTAFGCVAQSDKQYRCFPNLNLCDGVSQCENDEDETTCSGRTSYDGCYKYLTGQAGSFLSPNYPASYPAQIQCHYQIQVTPGKTVQLRFPRFDLGKGARLFVYNGPSDEYSLLGGEFNSYRQPPGILDGSNNSVLVKFITDYGVAPARGFNITYQEKGYCYSGQLPCAWDETECYDRTKKCDGHWDCPLHGGDERGCSGCSQSQFSCLQTKHCYEENERCNGVSRCSDKSDEKDCTADRCNHYNGTFLCDNGRCIFETWMCDRADDCRDGSDERHCSAVPSRRVIIAAVIGSLMCGLLLVLAIGCTCKLHAHRMSQLMGGYARYMTPVSRVEQEIWARQSAPPLYDEAMRTSRPYEEARLEFLAALEGEQNAAAAHAQQQQIELSTVAQSESTVPDVTSLSEPLLQQVTLPEAEVLINLAPSDPQPTSADDVDNDVHITLCTGAKAQWRRNRNKSRSSSTSEESSSGGGGGGVRGSSNCDMTNNASDNHHNKTINDVPLQLIDVTKRLTSPATVAADVDDVDDVVSHAALAPRIICDNMAFSVDDNDDVDVTAAALAADVLCSPSPSPDGASVAESETSLNDGDISMLSLD